MNIIKRYFKLWLISAKYSLQVRLFSWGSSLMYILGKFIRFGFFMLTIVIVLQQTKTMAGYNLNQMIIFFLIFELIDITGQLFYRGIYLFRNKVVNGHFDLILVKPANELFLVLTNQVDILDLPLFLVIMYMFSKITIIISPTQVLLFLLILFASFLIVTAVHISIASIGLITTEVENLVMIYRDLSLMAKVPVDIYVETVRIILTFILPIAIIFTFPAKALLGILSWQLLIFSLIISFVLFLLSLKFWQYALTKYSSASS